MTTASDETTQEQVKPFAADGRLSPQTLDNVRRNQGMWLEVPGPVIHHLRRGLHLALKAACERLAAEAAAMAEASRNRYAQAPASYNAPAQGPARALLGSSALDSLDKARKALDKLGWGATSSAPPEDIELSLDLDFGQFYEAITLGMQDDPADKPSGLDGLLEQMNACAVQAQEAYEEWQQHEQSKMGHSLMQFS